MNEHLEKLKEILRKYGGQENIFADTLAADEELRELYQSKDNK